jgi:hypothetical protein
MLNQLRLISKNRSSIKNAVRRNSSLKDVWFARKKKKTVLNLVADAKRGDPSRVPFTCVNTGHKIKMSEKSPGSVRD